MSIPAAPNPYLKTKILTASPEELRLMLYEGAIRFGRQAREALEAHDFEASYNALMRAQKIVLELSTSLNHQVAPELCGRLSALYTYIYRRLVDANVQRELAAIDEAVQLLEYEKQSWEMLMSQLARGEHAQAGAAAAQVAGAVPSSTATLAAGRTARANLTGAQQTAMSSLSLNG